MYEIWLIINTFYELALANLGLVLGTLIIWLVLMVIAMFTKRLPWRKGIKPAILIGMVLWVFYFVMMPGWTKSSFANVTYILDWLTLGGVTTRLCSIKRPLYLAALFNSQALTRFYNRNNYQLFLLLNKDRLNQKAS